MDWLLIGIIVSRSVMFVAEDIWIHMRQHSVISSAVTPPSRIAPLIPLESYNKSRLYALTNSSFSLWFVFEVCLSFMTRESIFNYVQVLVYLVLGWYAYVWKETRGWVALFGMEENSELTRTALFLITTSVVASVLDIPLKYYRTFVIEHQFGFNNQVTMLICLQFIVRRHYSSSRTR
jgi:hypothetical protein